MELLNVFVDFSYGHPWASQYTVEGRKKPIAEIYDLQSGDYLALFDAPTLKKRVFKTHVAARKWVVGKIEKYYGVTTDTKITNIL